MRACCMLSTLRPFSQFSPLARSAVARAIAPTSVARHFTSLVYSQGCAADRIPPRAASRLLSVAAGRDLGYRGLGMFGGLQRRLNSSTTKATDAAGGVGGTAPPEAGAADEASRSQTEEQRQQQAAEDQAYEDAYYADEPFAAKASRWLWTSIKYSAGIGIVALVFYAGYTIVVTLLPGGSSANAVMRRASEVLKADPEIHTAFGALKTYGEDFGARTEGRRYFVPEYKYLDDWDGQEYHRIKFNVEGERGRKAQVWAEVRKGSYDFRYLVVLAKDRSRVWSVVDLRRPEPTLEERQARVTSALQDTRWTFFADADVDVKAQSAQLGDYWLKVKCVRCDETPGACEEAGVASLPAWKTHKGDVIKGVMSVRELEGAAKDIIHKKKGWWPF